MKQTPRECARCNAKKIKIMTVEESKYLPGFLGKIDPEILESDLDEEISRIKERTNSQ